MRLPFTAYPSSRTPVRTTLPANQGINNDVLRRRRTEQRTERDPNHSPCLSFHQQTSHGSPIRGQISPATPPTRPSHFAHLPSPQHHLLIQGAEPLLLHPPVSRQQLT